MEKANCSILYVLHMKEKQISCKSFVRILMYIHRGLMFSVLRTSLFLK